MGAPTPAVAALQRDGIRHRLLEYELDPRAESYGLEAAEKLGLPPARIFKTLVASAGGGHTLALVPVDARLNTKALGKRARLADPAEAERITGYVKGGTSAIGGRRRLPVVVDVSVLEHETIVVNGGRRGLQVELAPEDLLRITRGRTAAVASRR